MAGHSSKVKYCDNQKQQITISSANVNSIQNSLSLLMEHMNQQKIDIFFLQETHRINLPILQPQLNAQNLSIYPNAASSIEADRHFKSGTAVLIRNSIKIHLQPVSINLIPNRAQFFKFSLGGSFYLMANLYMPSGKSHSSKQERENFLNTLERHIATEKFAYLFYLHIYS